MQPQRLTTPARLSRTLKFNASLKIIGFGLGAEVAQPSQTKAELAFVQAAFEGLPNPRWDFRATPTALVEGLHRLALVIRAPAGSATRGTATLRAAIRRKRFGMLTYTAALPSGEPLEFVLPCGA
jgi:hypothetical protein